MKEDKADLVEMGGARSLRVGNAAGDWRVFPKSNYAGNHGLVKQGRSYSNPHEMGLQRDQPVMSLKRHGP